MTNEEYIQTLLNGDPTESLQEAWQNEDLTLAEKAELVSELHMKSRMTLEGTARMTGGSPAQIQALLDLAMLSDEDLKLVSDADPPATTWFLFASANTDAILAGIQALRNPTNEHLLVAVYNAMRTSSGPSSSDRIAAIDSETLAYLSRKAKEYDKLNDWGKRFLYNLSRRKAKGQSYTEKQIDKLKEILLQLVESDVISRNSKDDDQTMCDEVMDALGV